MLENGSDLHVNECQKIRHYGARSTGEEEEKEEEERKMAIFTSRGAHVNCAIMLMLYTHSIGNPPENTMVVFKMRDSVPSARYSPFVMQYVNGKPRSSLFIESTDCMINYYVTLKYIRIRNAFCRRKHVTESIRNIASGVGTKNGHLYRGK